MNEIIFAFKKVAVKNKDNFDKWPQSIPSSGCG